jgi:4a-hydroxytetrahydrobiopterin dehydratase
MSELNRMNCEACREGAPVATPAEIERYKPLIPDWEIVHEDDLDKLKRTFAFSGFPQTIQFVNAVADLAEEAGHHPVMLVEFRAVTVRWWSHKIQGLHVNDFVMAAKTDAVDAKLEHD